MKSTTKRNPGVGVTPAARRSRHRGEFVARIRFMDALAESLHRYGTPADRLEDTLMHCAARLDLEAQFFASPTSILASYESPKGPVSRMIRVEESELNLGKLLMVDRVITALIRGELGSEEARLRLREIRERRDAYGVVVRVLVYAVASLLVARMLDGGSAEVTATAVISLFAGAICAGLSATGRMRPLAVSTAAMFASAAAFSVFPGSAGPSAYIVIVASLILLMPGLKVTTGMRELATQHLTAGTTRLMSALRTLLGSGFGVVAGRQIADALPAWEHGLVDRMLPEWTLWAAVILVPLPLAIDFRARLRDLLPVAFGCFVAYFSASWGRHQTGPELGAFLGALTVGVCGNLFAKVFDRPSSLVQIPGVTLLVPGSIGLRSVLALLDHDAMSGVETAFTMIMVGTALGSGLIVANVIVGPRKAL